MNEPDSHDAHKGWEMVLFSRRMGIRAFRYTTEIQWKGTSHHLMRHSGRPWGNRAPWLYDKCVWAAVILEWRTSPAVLHSSSLKMAFLKSTTSLLLCFTHVLRYAAFRNWHHTACVYYVFFNRKLFCDGIIIYSIIMIMWRLVLNVNKCIAVYISIGNNFPVYSRPAELWFILSVTLYKNVNCIILQ